MKTPCEANVTSKQCADVLSEQRKQYKGKEFYGVIKHFQDKALVDLNQYFVVDLFEDGSPRNTFWADGRSRDAYLKFGDVVVFDVTYMTNKFKMPFSPFVGVNHHGQSILFGGALLENENEETFQWLFEHFLKCMFNKYPSAIITDQYRAMGMTTCGQSESIHSFFFDEFVNSKTMLNEFVVQYDKAVASRRAVEEDEDFKTMNSKAVLSSVHPIEAKSGDCYTRKIFEDLKKWNLTHETLSKCTEEIKYRVGKVNVDRAHWRLVIFHLKNQVNVTCSFAKFETYGILCKHCLYVMKKRHVQTLPNHYILPRWTLDSRFKVSTCSIGLDEMNNEKQVSALTLWYVRANSNKAIEHAKTSPSKIRKLNSLLVKFLEDGVIQNKPNAPESPSQSSCAGFTQVDMMPQLSIRDPTILINTKGRPKNETRIKSSLEMAKKKRTCSH
ncbi:unnamed protein product [Lactuca saligna]|uniref:Zinc finger PMZ-type domain-containing protein n=1 Tax=Lactuca saligna TaxID=75948 RepID=A0AA36EG60_LACSI|nr:unnamed protein product [Lactuca saligna]